MTPIAGQLIGVCLASIIGQLFLRPVSCVVAVRVLYGTLPPHFELSRTGFLDQTLSDGFGQDNIRALSVGHYPAIVAVAFTRRPTIAARTYPGQSAPAPDGVVDLGAGESRWLPIRRPRRKSHCRRTPRQLVFPTVAYIRKIRD
jgi:hypothetical protein